MNAPIRNAAPDASGMLAAALKVAGHGFPVIPVNPATKRPATVHGFNDATVNHQQIADWWTKNPDAMIGVRTGEPSGLAVLDLDVQTDPETGEVTVDGSARLAEVMERNGWTLPPTMEVRTPRGGRHLYFLHDPGFTKSNSHSEVGIDYRCENGYIIYPPSRRANGTAYSFVNPFPLFRPAKAPEWLAEFFRTDRLPGLIEKKPKAAAAKAEVFVEISRTEDIERALNGYWNPDDYSDWVTAALALHNFPGGKEIWLGWASRSSKFDRAENDAKWDKTTPRSGSDSELPNEEGQKTGINERAILARVPKETLKQWGKDHAERSNPLYQLGERLSQRQRQRKHGDSAEQANASEPGHDDDTAAEPFIKVNGRAVANIANVLTVLRTAPEWQGVVAFDRMAAKMMLQAPLPDGLGRKPNDFSPRPMTDGDIVKAVEWFQRHGFASISKDTVGDGLALVAEENGFDPLEDKLRSLAWDGVPRLDGWLLAYCGAQPTATQPEAYIRAVGRCWLISAVARALRPGCKVDSALVLVGPQGVGKSTAGRILSYGWFSDGLPPVHSKDASDHLRGVWLVEFGEMAAASKAEVEEMKAFITRTAERFRPAYGRLEIEYPRRNVFFGTSNRDAFLKDETGNRRFWPVTVSKIDAAKLTEDRDQLWAEAVHAFDRGQQWHLTEEEAGMAAVQQAAFYDRDERCELLEPLLRGKKETTTLECLDLLGMNNQRPEQMAMSKMLQALGWRSQRTGRRRFWIPPVTTSNPEVVTVTTSEPRGRHYDPTDPNDF